MFQDLLKWGGKRPEVARPSTASPSAADDVVVPSKALPKFLSALTQSESPVLVDFGDQIGGVGGIHGCEGPPFGGGARKFSTASRGA